MEKESQRAMLIQYLLGELPPETEMEVAQRYFEDDDWFEELLETENHLLDRYVRGALSENQQQSFRNYLNRLPDGAQRLAFAQSLMQVIDEEKRQQTLPQTAIPELPSRAVTAPVGTDYAPSFWQIWRQAFTQKAFQFSFAVALLMMSVGLFFLVSYVKKLRLDNAELRDQLSRIEQEKQALEQGGQLSQADANAERLRQLEEQLRIEQQLNDAQTQKLASTQNSPPVVAWVLTPPLVRAANQADRVPLPHAAKFITLTLPLEGYALIGNCRVVVQTTDGQQRREWPGLRADKKGKAVSLKLPAETFSATDYKITLVGKDTDDLELAIDYYLTIIRK